jgi:multidrug efflux pump subunit AcrB
MLPREEEPQIIVPMIDVMVQMPGASPKEIEERVTKPMEKLLGRFRALSTFIPRRRREQR